MTQPMTSKRVEAILAAYGSDPRRWPDAERTAALALLARSPDGHARADAARALDAALDHARADVPAAVAARVASRIDRSVAAARVAGWDVPDIRWGAFLWNATAATWPRAAALVGVVMLGIVVGLSSDPPSAGTDGFLYGSIAASETALLGGFTSWSE
jgi:hypothetical protein